MDANSEKYSTLKKLGRQVQTWRYSVKETINAPPNRHNNKTLQASFFLQSLKAQRKTVLQNSQPLILKKFSGLFNRFGKHFFLERFRHIHFHKVGRIPDFTSRHHGIDCSENHSCNGDDCPFLASAFGDILIFQTVVRRFFGFHGCMCSLY